MAFLEALSAWAKALELQMEAMPETLTYDAPRGQSGIDRQVPWIPAGWRRFRTVVAVLQRLQEAHAPMAQAREVRAMIRRLLRQERVDLWANPTRASK